MKQGIAKKIERGEGENGKIQEKVQVKSRGMMMYTVIKFKQAQLVPIIFLYYLNWE